MRLANQFLSRLAIDESAPIWEPTVDTPFPIAIPRNDEPPPPINVPTLYPEADKPVVYAIPAPPPRELVRPAPLEAPPPFIEQVFDAITPAWLNPESKMYGFNPAGTDDSLPSPGITQLPREVAAQTPAQLVDRPPTGHIRRATLGRQTLVAAPGQEIVERAYPAASPSRDTSSSSRTWIAIVAGALVVVVLLVALFRR